MDPPVQLQAGRPTLEIVDWHRNRSSPYAEFIFELRPAARIQGASVKLIKASNREEKGPILKTVLAFWLCSMFYFGGFYRLYY
ncbi:MAG: hypothetical protein GY820_03425 [Gammaproteobacteria bacterium]|nr:hypothetical protein [Gammaproteobacteria bacterium]